MNCSAILIDDEVWTRDILRTLGDWDGLGIEITAEASDGEYGLELINRLHPDIIITDVRMPHMDGIALVTALRESGNQAKVIFVSGYDDYAFVREAMKLQAVDYLLKPVKPDELNERLQACADEIRVQKNEQSVRDLDLQGFMDVAWIQEYRALQKSVFDSLRSNESSVLRADFDRLSGFLCGKESGVISKSLIICIYFDLHRWLQQYISENGYTIADIYPGQLKSFVFSNDFLLADMLGYIRTLYEDAQQRIVHLKKSKNRIDIQQVKSYIDANYCGGITLENTAARFFVSKEYLSKVFKLESGIGFSDYITALRMQKAKVLLQTNKVPIKDAAWMTGYADQQHFHKAVKKYYGMTPGDMQREIKN